MKRCWYINDAEDVARSQIEVLGTLHGVSGWDFRIFETALDAFRAVREGATPPHVFVIDMSAVGSIVGGPVQCYSAICGLYSRCSASHYVLQSAVSYAFLEEVRNEVLEHEPEMQGSIELINYDRADEQLAAILTRLLLD